MISRKNKKLALLMAGLTAFTGGMPAITFTDNMAITTVYANDGGSGEQAQVGNTENNLAGSEWASTVSLANDVTSVFINGIRFELTDSTNKYVGVSGHGDGMSADLILPSKIICDGIEYTVTSIEGNAFNSCDTLTSINMPTTITKIGEGAFCNCSGLTQIEIPNSIISMEERIFYGCSGIINIKIPSGVLSIGNLAFQGCTKLVSVEIPNTVKDIGFNAFFGCSSLQNVKIPSSVTSIGTCAFNGCSSLQSIEIPNSVASIGFSSFIGCPTTTKYIVYSDDIKDKIKNSTAELPDSSITKAILNTDELVKLYNDNKEMTQEKYTSDSFKIFVQSLNDAKKVLDNSNSTQSEVDSAKIILQESINKLATAVTQIVISGENAIKQKGGNIALTVTVSPQDAKNKEVTWSIVSGSEFASLSETGILTASKNGNGNVTVRAIAKDGSNVYGEKIIAISNNGTGDNSGGSTSNSSSSHHYKKNSTSTETSTTNTTTANTSTGATDANTTTANTSAEEAKDNKVVVYGNKKTEIKNAFSNKNANTVVVVLNDLDNKNEAGSDKESILILNKDILNELKTNPDKTLIIQNQVNNNGSAAQTTPVAEVKYNKEGQVRFTQNNSPITGVKTIGNGEYYLNNDGIMQTGWVKISGDSWYHFDKETGIKSKDWIQENNTWYYLNKNSGEMETGWLKDNDSWYYLNNNGAMKTGWLQDNGSWYYLNNNGTMKTGWLQDNEGKWYYLNTNGTMAANETIDGYYVDENGVWVG